jgi:hypothetical protein
LPVLLDEPETWSLTLRKGHIPKKLENRLLRRILLTLRDEFVKG